MISFILSVEPIRDLGDKATTRLLGPATAFTYPIKVVHLFTVLIRPARSPLQVKNFGRSGRTKYTHLVEQDTTSFDSAWAMETAQNAKFFNVQAGGVKQVFEKPSLKKKRKP